MTLFIHSSHLLHEKNNGMIHSSNVKLFPYKHQIWRVLAAPSTKRWFKTLLSPLTNSFINNTQVEVAMVDVMFITLHTKPAAQLKNHQCAKTT
ncbi:hypothetical protein KHA80_14860 [Anaerobacillus sp. HL2]|nr:hypothetical protein KHA80_14860 [Anaerobacillus sp. HL2]